MLTTSMLVAVALILPAAQSGNVLGNEQCWYVEEDAMHAARPVVEDP